jgi:mono/diheme cytochrome c family protein
MVSIRHICLILGAAGLLAAADQPTLDKTVQPVLAKTCTPCHNEKLASGGLNITGFTKAASVMDDRAGWERILDKVRSGEMPPKGVPRPPQLDAVVQYLQGEFEKADRNTKPDPGRVTARRSAMASITSATFSPSRPS